MTSATMLAGRIDWSSGDPRFVMQEVLVPEAGPGQVRLKVMSAGVCLSDVHLISGEIRPRFAQADVIALGHEVAGVVDAVGEGVTIRHVGERVIMEGSPVFDGDGNRLTAGVDYDGGWAQYVVVPATFINPIPDDITFDVASIIPDAISTPWSAIHHTAKVRAGEAVGVWGVGGLGSHAVKLLRMIGAVPVIAVDLSADARARAAEYGADLVLDPTSTDFADRVRDATGGRGLDVAFDFAGANPARSQAAASLGKNGRLILVGIAGKPVTVDDDITFQLLGQEIRGHYGSAPGTIADLITFIGHGRANFDASITEVLPLEQAPTAVEHLEKKIGNPIRIVLHPNG